MTTIKVQIQDCADVQPGYSSKGAIVNEPEGTLQVITAQHLTKGEPYRYIDDHRLLIRPPKFYDKYLVSPGDLLFMSRGANNYAVLIESVPQPAIAPLTFFIIKPRLDMIVPEYLAWCFEQDHVKAQLNELRTGAGTPMIPSSGFRELELHLPDLATQQKVAQLAQHQRREKQLLQLLTTETDRLHQLIGRKLVSGFDNHRKE